MYRTNRYILFKKGKLNLKLFFLLFRDYELIDCCWICEGWQESEFSWDSGNILFKKNYF